MEAALPTFAPFSLGGDPAKAKFLVLGLPSITLLDRARSLNLEHVSAAELVRQEISRRTPGCRQAAQAQERGKPVPDEIILALLRRWFWTRKPDAGFVLTEFPATLLQAVVFDEWLEARGTALDAVLLGEETPASPILDHYRQLGIDLFDTSRLVA
ncbi:MAG TPA: nucleoside monophosphate kinase [Candidatus Synoicihabitans sp.]|nr:nucleoside monophosphate kinase [Candidatus Synoicihabitans sp.]